MCVGAYHCSLPLQKKVQGVVWQVHKNFLLTTILLHALVASKLVSILGTLQDGKNEQRPQKTGETIEQESGGKEVS